MYEGRIGENSKKGIWAPTLYTSLFCDGRVYALDMGVLVELVGLDVRPLYNIPDFNRYYIGGRLFLFNGRPCVSCSHSVFEIRDSLCVKHPLLKG